MNFNQKIKQLFLLTLIIMFTVASFSTLIIKSYDKLEVFAWDGIAYTEPAGLGTYESPYLIGTAEELFWVSSETNDGLFLGNEYFELTANLSLEGYEWTPIGNYNTGSSSTAFRGNFDGNGFTISNFKLEDSQNINTYSGLFGYLDSADIKDLRVRQVSLDLDLVSFGSDFYAGAVAGYSLNSSLSNINNSGSIQISNGNNAVYAGGFLGYAEGSQLELLFNSVTTTTSQVSSVCAGGLVGKTLNSEVDDSYNKGAVTASAITSAFVGGLVGEATETDFKKVFNSSSVRATSDLVSVGGLVGILGSDAGVVNLTTKFAYNVGRVTLVGSNELQTELYLGGLFGQVEERNIISYVYNAGEVQIDSLASAEGLDTLNKGALMGQLNLEAQITSSYYDRDKANLGTLGIGTNNGTAILINDLSTTNMKYPNSFDNGVDWNFNTTWVSSGYVNSRYPALRHLGNYSVHVQVFGPGTVTPTGTQFYELGSGRVYTINANAGFQIKQVYSGSDILPEYNGNYNSVITVNDSGLVSGSTLNLAVEFEKIPFTKTQMFYWLVGVGSLIILMIVGTAIINYRYAVKMDKIIDEKKKSLNLEGDKKKK